MRQHTSRTFGLDLGDKWTHLCELGEDGEVVRETRIRTTPAAFRRFFEEAQPGRAALEAGTHSNWSARLLEELGRDPLVANPRQLALITRNDRKSDRTDAELLARLARADPNLLSPVQPRDAQTQADRTLVASRDTLVRMRTLLVNHVRGVVKSFGVALPKCDPDSFGKKVGASIPAELRVTLDPLLTQIAECTRTIRSYDRRMERVAAERYPAARHLRQITGVGPITSLAYVLAIGNPTRFAKSRKVGAFFGLAPRKDQSGETDKQLRITKAGDPLVRRLLLQCAQYMLGPFGEDSDLRRWAERKTQHGGKAAKKRALVAVARKLAVRMHRIWITGEVYDPLRLAKARGELTA